MRIGVASGPSIRPMTVVSLSAGVSGLAFAAALSFETTALAQPAVPPAEPLEASAPASSDPQVPDASATSPAPAPGAMETEAAASPGEAPTTTVADPTAYEPPPPAQPEPAAATAPLDPASALAEPPPEKPEAPPSPAYLPLQVAGSFWSRYELRSGYQDHGLTHPRLHREGDYVVSRARLGLSTNPVDVGDGTRVSATFVPQAAFTFAENLGGPATIGDGAPLSIYEAFARVGTDVYQFDMGRFALNYGDALVIGNLGWNEAARAFYGTRLHLTPGPKPYFIDVLATLVDEGRLEGAKPFSGDTMLYGIYSGLGPLIGETIALDAYLLGQTVVGVDDVTDAADPTVVLGDSKTASEFTLGARVLDKISSFDYRLEAGLQFGTRPVAPSAADASPDAQGVFAYQADAEVGVAPAEGLRLGLGGLIASGDDPTTDDNEGYDQLYPTAHKFLGLADIAGGRTNMTSGNLHVLYKAHPELILKLDGHIFNRLEVPDDAETYMGSELDLNVVHPIGAGAVLRAMYALFLPNKDFWEPTSTQGNAGDPLHYLEIQFGYDFK